MTVGRDRRALAGPACLLGLALLVGLLTGVDPKYGVVAAMGLAFVTIVMSDLSVGLCLYALLAFLNIVPDAGGGFVSFDKVAGALVALSWLATVAGRKQVRRAFITDHPQFSAVLGFFLIWVVLSLTWSEQPDIGLQYVARFVLDAFLFLIVYTAVRTRQHVTWLVGAFVAASTLSGAYGMIAPPAPGTQDRLAGTIGEPNQLAAVLVAGVVLALALAVLERGKPLLRLILIGASVICMLATFLTLSRAGLIALICAALAAILVGGRWRAAAAGFALATVAALVVFFALIASPDQRARVTEINGGSGRSDIWVVGWRMVQAHPVHGIGVGQFQTSAVHYLIEPGTIKRSDLIIVEPKVAHNIYLQVLSELGVVGLIPFLIILGFSLRCALRAAHAFERRKDLGMEVMARGVFVALIGILTADFFASEQFSKQLWLLLGLGPALLAMSSRRSIDEDTADDPPAPLAPSRLEPAASTA